VLNLHIIDLARKYHTHLQREIEKEEARERKRKEEFSLIVMNNE
jgi:hypothetical protein